MFSQRGHQLLHTAVIWQFSGLSEESTWQKGHQTSKPTVAFGIITHFSREVTVNLTVFSQVDTIHLFCKVPSQSSNSWLTEAEQEMLNVKLLSWSCWQLSSSLADRVKSRIKSDRGMARGKEKTVLAGKKEVSLWLEYVWVLIRDRKAKMCAGLWLHNYYNVQKIPCSY